MLAVPSVGPASDFRLSVEQRGQLTLGKDDFLPFDESQAELGRLLFYDPILSGNRNISCGTCHHHSLHSNDGVSLGLGQGGQGIGADRKALGADTAIHRRMSRNSPALFNLGAREVFHLFHDGRVSLDDYYGTKFNTPAEEFLPEGLSSLLAAQSLFPLVGEVEMAGNLEDNEVAPAVNQRIDYGWPLIVARIRDVSEYESLFVEAFDDVQSFQDITIVHMANAIGEFINGEWRSHDSPFDDYVAGNDDAISGEAKEGMKIFFGKGNCSFCHAGKLFTDHQFHALAIPPFGPGRTRKFDPHIRDVGRMGETDLLEDAYRFRTPSLRNVELTAPYGHNGAFPALEAIIRHHANPSESLANWQPSSAILPDQERFQTVDFVIVHDRLEMERYREHVDIVPVSLTDDEVNALVAFLKTLTGQESTKGRLGAPNAVPSGLPID